MLWFHALAAELGVILCVYMVLVSMARWDWWPAPRQQQIASDTGTVPAPNAVLRGLIAPPCAGISGID